MSRAVEAVITRLEMTEPPASFPPQPAGPRLALVKAERIPLHFYRYLYENVGRPWLWLERAGISDAELAERIHKPGVEIHVLYAEGAPAGYFELEAGLEVVTLVYFGLFPEWIGHGIGPWLLGAAIRQAFSFGPATVRVNTCTLDHPAALPLYQRLGFVPVSRQTAALLVPDEAYARAAVLQRP
ncbi:GNAT family N-acetyltransferase [Propylenella binzhouense]|uniref:GNAT family N-acetyltransferase n=1 Tax=Propylenella binzhouense TaxID=2555902 RepID=A0A964T6J2_9HYPH|nr:GNAT family N-acetyltransferase [Propylenella binzhouense]MYZ49466.1 GNAT family N-acetyltransferase [Propylenella binzhouense]